MVRRIKVGAELGGPRLLKVASAGPFVIMWIGYICLSAWWSLRQNAAGSDEKFYVFIILGIAMVAPCLMFLVVAVRHKRIILEPENPTEREKQPASAATASSIEPKT